MSSALKQALIDMREEGIDPSYLYFSRAILEFTKNPEKKSKTDFRSFNKKSIEKIIDSD